MSFLVVTQRTEADLQPIIDQAPIAFQYCTDGLSTYEALNYHTAFHLVALGKSLKEIAEGGNADLRHHLARLAKKSRCFTRSVLALVRTIAFFVQCMILRKLF